MLRVYWADKNEGENMLIFLLCLTIYLFESLRSKIVILTINHKLSKCGSDKQLSRWTALVWPLLYCWLAFRKKSWWKDLVKFLSYKEPK